MLKNFDKIHTAQYNRYKNFHTYHKTLILNLLFLLALYKLTLFVVNIFIMLSYADSVKLYKDFKCKSFNSSIGIFVLSSTHIASSSSLLSLLSSSSSSLLSLSSSSLSSSSLL